MADKKVIVDLNDTCFLTQIEWKRGGANHDSECVVKIVRVYKATRPLEITLRGDLSLLNLFPSGIPNKVKLGIEFVTEEAKE